MARKEFWLVLMVSVLLGIVMLGCASTAQVAVQNPPEYNTASVKLLGIETETTRSSEAAIGQAWETQITQAVQATNRYTVITPDQTQRLLNAGATGSSLIGKLDAYLKASIDTITGGIEPEQYQAKNAEGAVVTLTRYKQALNLTCTFQLLNASTGTIIGGPTTKTYSFNETQNDAKQLTAQVQIVRNIITQQVIPDLNKLIAPYTTMLKLKFMQDKMKDEQMKEAGKIFNNGKGDTKQAVALWQSIYEKTGNVAAGYNAALGTYVMGDLAGAVRMMQAVYTATGNAEAGAQLNQLQSIYAKQMAAQQQSTTQSPIDKAVSDAESQLKTLIPANSRVAFFNTSSSDKDTVDYAINKISQELGNGMTIVDRESIAAVMQEQNLQLSGAVSDDSMVGIGHTIGADIMIMSSITGQGTMRSLNFRILKVETSEMVKNISIQF
jgi:hypothetical protein